ncbi:unnamed protein product [Adineta steineri]|uniref:WWE domain-containing protein n=1 Tax=Adineta steineri TaxID=433720 RepID=A0A813VF06_9BILA|nr:unnamed protein product [Adineta steineri]CAF1100684.1 unnamed protein product [Adineta steineri]CAF3850588.1 unnamed protein product [Adineta steineri]
MASSVEEELQTGFIWEWKTNIDPWSETQTEEWTSYSGDISSVIEKAYKERLEQVSINEDYCISLKDSVQFCKNDTFRQRPVRRRKEHLPLMTSIDAKIEGQSMLQKRLSSPLGVPLRCGVTGDTTHYGSTFIQEWLLDFTKGKMEFTFDNIFPFLLDGLIKEGETKSQSNSIETDLRKVEQLTRGQKSSERIAQLEDCCAIFYTKDSYIYRVVNKALRNNDRTKLFTLGPFCHLLLCYIGRRFEDNSTIGDRLRQTFSVNKMQTITIYRGDFVCRETLEEYRQAAGDNTKHFKWLPFVSTSRKEKKALEFRGNILYKIEMPSYSSKKDQFRDIKNISHFKEEEEILLLPGVQFHVNKLEVDNETKRHTAEIKIHLSYISTL